MADRFETGQFEYECIAEELSDPTMTLDDMDRRAVKAALRWAAKARRAWPPKPTTAGWQVTVWSA